MIKEYFFLLIILIFSSIAFAVPTVEFTIVNKKIKFYKYVEQRITMSIECDKIQNDRFCDEINFLKTISLKDLKTEAGGGENIGSLLCNAALKGIVVMGTTNSGNQNSFCKIGSLYIDNGTLEFYANENNR